MGKHITDADYDNALKKLAELREQNKELINRAFRVGKKAKGQRAKHLKMLKKVERKGAVREGWSDFKNAPLQTPICMFCQIPKHSGHADDCELAAAIKELKKDD